MAFQVKDFTSIIASMVNHIRGATKKLTDFNVGSVNRSMIEAVAVEVDELYQQMFNGLRDAIPSATYLSFGFGKLPKASAYVDITFIVNPLSPSPITIDAGTKVKVPGASFNYLTESELIIPANDSFLSVRVIADTPGTIGNALAASITEMVTPIADVYVSNLLPATLGRDEESEDERAIRFADFIKSISRAPVFSVEFGALTSSLVDNNNIVTEYVAKAKIVEPYETDNTQPLGYIDCYIYNGLGGTSQALKVETQRIIDGYRDADNKRVPGWKAAGVVCSVKVVAEQNIDVTVTLVADDGVSLPSLIAEVRNRLASYIQELDIGEKCLRSELISIAITVPGVYNVGITDPATDVTPDENIKLIPGTMTIS